MATARHSKATFFVQQQLFSGLTSFAKLEQKIAALPDEHSRGAAFEVFAEAYLATQRKHDATQVWPLATAPTDVLQKIALPLDDYGVDGVLQTTLGQINAYQVKFRTNRTALQWNKDKLSNFVGLSDSPNIHSRILFTNSDELPAVMNKRRGFFCIRGSDLDRLETDDFRAIEAWLADAAFVAPKKSPDKDHKHQAEALDALLPALQKEPRVSAIMACGTGKTLVALWVTERLEAKRVLILLPSLALLRQTLHEWLRETRLPMLAYLCVCSDKSVKEGLDALKTEQSDLDFQVSTESVSVRGFLDAPFAGVKMIFCTYQSASVVGAAMQTGEAFDFAVFDEAHKTAGSEGRNNAYALHDKNLPIRKRLFLTATPRHYNPLDKNRDGDAQIIFSMDNAETYGPVVYRLPFSKAAKRGIICRYEVVISVITSQQVTNELLSRGEVLVNCDPVRARQVANQIALKEAVAKFGVKKIFTFHSTVTSAASFTSRGNEGIKIHLPDFKTLHVNGAMPTASRERVMREFRECKRGIVSNARCLTEGVDVPSVDMVAFLAPRRSRVDIVQATGRAMRKADDKTAGYVLVPLFVEQATDETVEEAVLRSDFKEVWSVLQSLQEQDENLEQIIQDMRIQRGRTKGFDDSRFREKVVISGPQISLESLRETITTQCVNAIGENWHERYGQLLAYKETHGDCNVPKGFVDNKILAGWVIRQRVLYKAHRLESSKVSLLNELGFIWNPSEALWFENYAKLLKYHEKYQTCRVPQDWEHDKVLGKWVSTQRVYYNRGWLSQERIALLEKLNFERTGEKATWEMRFAELKAYKDRFQDTRVPVRWEENPLLGKWVSAQRHDIKKGKISNAHGALLDSIGFVKEATNAGSQRDFWGRQIGAILRFKSEHGHFVVPRKGKELTNLAAWMSDKRSKYKNGTIDPELKSLLDAIEFPWISETKPGTSEAWRSIYDKHWHEMLARLEAYVSVHGSTNIIAVDDETTKLKGWVKSQKDAQRDERLSQEKIQLLDQRGFVWAKPRKNVVVRYQWHEMFQQFKRYMSVHANPDIVVTNDGTAKLKAWVKSQKDTYRREKLSREKIDALEQNGLVWAKPRKMLVKGLARI